MSEGTWAMKRWKGSLLNDSIVACAIVLLVGGAAFFTALLIPKEDAMPRAGTWSAPILVEEATDLFFVV